MGGACPDKFATADVAYLLAFALIMLHTDAHNPGIKNKMTKDEFVLREWAKHPY